MFCCPVGQESGGVDFRTLGNQTAARVLEEVHVHACSSILDKYIVLFFIFLVVPREQFGHC